MRLCPWSALPFSPLHVLLFPLPYLHIFPPVLPPPPLSSRHHARPVITANDVFLYRSFFPLSTLSSSPSYSSSSFPLTSLTSFVLLPFPPQPSQLLLPPPFFPSQPSQLLTPPSLLSSALYPPSVLSFSVPSTPSHSSFPSFLNPLNFFLLPPFFPPQSSQLPLPSLLSSTLSTSSSPSFSSFLLSLLRSSRHTARLRKGRPCTQHGPSPPAAWTPCKR